MACVRGWRQSSPTGRTVSDSNAAAASSQTARPWSSSSLSPPPAGVVADEPVSPAFVRHDAHPVDPDDPLRPVRQGDAGPREPVPIGEIVVRQPVFKVVGRVRRRGRRPGGAEQPQRVVRPLRIAPEPEHAAPVLRRLHAVLPEDPAVRVRGDFLPEQYAVPPPPGPGQPGEAFRGDGAVHPNHRRPVRVRHDPHAAEAEPVGGDSIAVAADREPDLPADQIRLRERGPAGVVGHEPHAVRRFQFDQRDPASGGGVDDPHLRGRECGRGEDDRAEERHREHDALQAGTGRPRQPTAAAALGFAAAVPSRRPAPAPPPAWETPPQARPRRDGSWCS